MMSRGELIKAFLRHRMPANSFWSNHFIVSLKFEIHLFSCKFLHAQAIVFLYDLYNFIYISII